MAQFTELILDAFSNRRVGIVEFAESDEFCGKQLYPRQRVLLKLVFLEEMAGWEEDILTEWASGAGEVTLSPGIRERREWLRDNDYRYFPEIVIVGGRRSSKGFITALALAKIMYETQKLGDPGTHYGIDPDKEIYFSCVAAAQDQAKKFQFADLVSAATRCKALKVSKVQEQSFTLPTAADRNYLLQMQNRGMNVRRDFAKLRAVPLAANADTLRGSATLATVFDEMAFMQSGESNQSAERCYNALKPSLDQFGKAAIIFLNSSPATRIGKFYDRWEDSMETDNGKPKYPMLMSIQLPSWELYKDYKDQGKYSIPDNVFKEAIMVSPDLDPETLSPEDAAKCIKARAEEESDPQTFKVERRGIWAEVYDAYLDEKKVNAAFSGIYQNRIFTENKSGAVYGYRYKMHCDPSSTTAGFGFAVAHTEYFDDTVMNPNTRTEDVVRRPHVVFDLVHRWNPHDFAEKTIEWDQVIDELMWYLKIFHPEQLTFDQHNSVYPIQSILKRARSEGISTYVGERTATKQVNWNRWELFKTATNLGLVHIPPDCGPDGIHSTLGSLELKYLRETAGRIDKPDDAPIKTKDIADCIAECTHYLLNSEAGFMDSLHTPPQFGAQGGYTSFERTHPYAALEALRASRNGGGTSNPAQGMGHRMRRRARF